jgi:hypothetical protein
VRRHGLPFRLEKEYRLCWLKKHVNWMKIDNMFKIGVLYA